MKGRHPLDEDEGVSSGSWSLPDTVLYSQIVTARTNPPRKRGNSLHARPSWPFASGSTESLNSPLL